MNPEIIGSGELRVCAEQLCRRHDIDHQLQRQAAGKLPHGEMRRSRFIIHDLVICLAIELCRIDPVDLPGERKPVRKLFFKPTFAFPRLQRRLARLPADGMRRQPDFPLHRAQYVFVVLIERIFALLFPCLRCTVRKIFVEPAVRDVRPPLPRFAEAAGQRLEYFMRIVAYVKRINGVFPRRDNLKPITDKMLVRAFIILFKPACASLHFPIQLRRRFRLQLPRGIRAADSPQDRALPLREFPIPQHSGSNLLRARQSLSAAKGTKGLRRF